MENKNYYIITFDGQIFEVKYSEESLRGAFIEWRKGGIIILKDKGGIHAGVVSGILTANEYENWYKTTKPKEYLKAGTWYDGKENQVIRHEKWKEQRIEDEKKSSLSDGMEEINRTPEETTALFEKYRPEFMKRMRANKKNIK